MDTFVSPIERFHCNNCRDHLAKEESAECQDLKEAMAVMELMDTEENQVSNTYKLLPSILAHSSRVAHNGLL